MTKKNKLILSAINRDSSRDPEIIWGDEYEFRKKHGQSPVDVPYKEFTKHFKFGNEKVGSEIGIFNLGSAKECTSCSRGFCQVGKKCYARRDEVQYQAPYLYRERQRRLWDVISPNQFVEHTVRKYNKGKKEKK